jgi:hypothetical protein
MNATGINIIRTKLEKNLNFELKGVKYDKSRLMKRARYIYQNQASYENKTWGECLKESWADQKKAVLKRRKNAKYYSDKLAGLLTPQRYEETTEFQQKMMYKAMEMASSRGEL